MLALRYDAEVLAPLTGLSALHTLRIEADGMEEVGVLWQVMGLQGLELFAPRAPEGLLMKTAQLKQLTKLTFIGVHKGEDIRLELSAQVGRCDAAADSLLAMCTAWPNLVAPHIFFGTES